MKKPVAGFNALLSKIQDDALTTDADFCYLKDKVRMPHAVNS
jgi:hypothetical protein